MPHPHFDPRAFTYDEPSIFERALDGSGDEVIKLAKRSSCSAASQCHAKLKANAKRICTNGHCAQVCKSGYKSKNAKCVKTAAATTKKTTTTKNAAAAKATVAKAASIKTGTVLAASGVTSFTGSNSGIGSWYHTDASSDSTNGHSWCGFPYNDNVPGFAPSVGTMLKNFGGDYTKAATAYCGLEAEVCNGSNCMTMVIADGFDDAWVLSPGSIDIIYNSFIKLFGKSTSNKNDVIKGVTWKLTGARNDQYKFKGQGSG